MYNLSIMRKHTITMKGETIEFSRPYSWQTEEGGWICAQTMAFVCPVCLEIWGRSYIEGEGRYRIVGRECEVHGGGNFISEGWWGWDPALLDYAPLPFLQREIVILTSKNYEERYEDE